MGASAIVNQIEILAQDSWKQIGSAKIKSAF